MPEPLLDVRDLSVSFRTESGLVRAVDGVSFSIGLGEVLGIVGESGSGKTVAMLTVMRLIRDPNAILQGQVLYRGRDLMQLSQKQMRDVRGSEIAMIFQDPLTALTPVYTVGWQIEEQLRAHQSLTRRRARTRATELMAEVGIPNASRRIDDYPHQFSGGMRQRVMIAMALSCNPSLLIADEPTTALDVTVQARILDLLEELRQRHNMAMILITHDMGVVAEAADEVAVMYAGQIVERADILDLFDRPEHPYTEALLGALPQIEDDRTREERLATIPGRPPNLVDPPPACRFAPRCPYSSFGDSCTVELPELREIRPSHWVRTAHPASERQEAPVEARA
ncbi:MAG: ABC transporter ATP-binding protein [Gaiellaceae bacterium]